MDRCKHEMNPEWCSDCRETPAVSAPLVVRTFEAMYPGRCAVNAAHRIEPGDYIGVTEDGEYLCEECST